VEVEKWKEIKMKGKKTGAKIEVDDLEAIVVEEEIGPEIKIAGVLMDQTVHSSNNIYQIQFQAAMVLFLMSQ